MGEEASTKRVGTAGGGTSMPVGPEEVTKGSISICTEAEAVALDLSFENPRGTAENRKASTSVGKERAEKGERSELTGDNVLAVASPEASPVPSLAPESPFGVIPSDAEVLELPSTFKTSAVAGK